MEGKSQPFRQEWTLAIVFLTMFTAGGAPADFASICRDRTAVERVYYDHRLGDKPAFEMALPVALIERLVRDDLRRECVLKKVYGVEITQQQIETEVRRINATTRAPEVLAALKTALGNDPTRFARTVAKPLVVERELRNRFDNDESLNRAQRCAVEAVREQVLAAKQRGEPVGALWAILHQSDSNRVSETTWRLHARPLQKTAESPDPRFLEPQNRSGRNVEAISSCQNQGNGGELYFDDLPRALQTVLRSQLRQSGDISAVIELPGEITLFLAKEKSVESVTVTALSMPTKNYEEWLREQGEGEN